jgi:RNA polymerase sigma factor (sigma-70 family)
MTDEQLLRAFVEDRDQGSFRAIVDRYADLVYGGAVRQVGRSSAEDVFQAVFIVLARKAHRIDGRVLAGWLVNTTRLTALSARRNESRLKDRERKAATMRQEVEQQPAELDEISPLLDEALGRLGEKDRNAVTLRYMQGKSVGEVATAMGITEDAASKRVLRAMSRLREDLSRRGITISAAAVGEMMLRSQMKCPPGVASSAASVALAGKATVGATAAGALAKGVLIAMNAKATFAALAAAVVLLLMGVGTYVFISRAPHAEAAATSQAARIKVGVIVSHYTATGPSWIGKPYGYFSLQQVLKELRDPSLELIPVIEPGSEVEPGLKAELRKDFAGAKPVVAIDAGSLAKLDVIVAAGIANANKDLLNAVEGRVKAGGGFLIRESFGVVTPGYNEQVTALNGLAEGNYGFTLKGGVAKVAMEHPLLGTLKVGDRVGFIANGAFGILPEEGKGLVELVERGNHRPVGYGEKRRADFMVFPLFISQLGEGRIVGCSFPHSQPIPPELNAATGGKFTVRCVKWLAGEKLD